MAVITEERQMIREQLLDLERQFDRADILAEFEAYKAKVRQLEVVNSIRTAVGSEPFATVTDMIANRGE